MFNSTPTREMLECHLKVARNMLAEYQKSLQSTAETIAKIEQEIEAEMVETGEPSEATQDLFEWKTQQAMTRYDIVLTEQDIAHYVEQLGIQSA